MKRISTLIILGLAALSPSFAQERSDLEIVRDFRQKAKALDVMIDSARSVQECADIQVTIDQLREEFGPHKELLDRSLYERDYEAHLSSMTGELMLAKNKLGVIESQVTRIAELETQVRELSAEVERLKGENANLLGEIDRLSGNIKNLSIADAASSGLIDSLKRVIGQLQKGLRARDDMIFAMVDSMFMQYDKEIAQIGDTEKRGLVMKLDRNNVISSVSSSIQNNIRFLERAELKGSDLAAILKEQNRFATQWAGIGPKVANLYVAQKKRAQELAMVDTLLKTWASRATEAYWRGLAQAFESRQMTLAGFSNGTEFTTSLTGFISNEMKSEKTSEEKTKSWAVFEEFWNAELHTSWLPLMADRGDISQEQKTAIEEQVDDWRSGIQPSSTLMYIVFIVVLIGLVLFLWMRTKKQESTPPKA